MSNKKTFITKDKFFYKSLITLAAPIALQNLVSFLMTLTSSIMIGQLGEDATAAAYAGTLTFTVLQMLATGVDSGITVSSSRCWGDGDTAKIKSILACGVYLSLGFGIPITAISLIHPNALVSLFLSGGGTASGGEYLRLLALSFIPFVLSGAIGSCLRSIESPKITTIASASAFVVNLVFGYLLVFGKLGFTKYGLIGAAIATTIARIAELAIVLIYILFIDKKLKARLRDLFYTNARSMAEFLKYTAPIVLAQAVWIVNTLFSSYLISKVGTDPAVAALAVANTLNSLSYILMNGLSGAVGIIIGKTIGEGRVEKIKEYAYTTQLIFIVLGAITATVLLIARQPFVSLYDIGNEASKIAIQLISVLSLTIVGTSYQSACLIGLVKSGGDVSFILKNDSFFIFLVVIPLSITAARLGAPLWLIFLALKSDQILKCIPAAIKINRFRWIKKL